LVRSLYAWWYSKEASSVPDRSAVDPADLKRMLPNILISEVHHEPFRIRYRLVGTKVVEVTGFDIVGRFLDELLPAEPNEPWMDHYRWIHSHRLPLLGSTTVPTSAGAPFTYEFGIFPLRKGSESIEQFIAVEDYFDLRTTLIDLVPWGGRG
jgi:hypothetical protein